ncbi:MAG: type I-A CRISPR-associated protein Cas7/Csa2 [Crenarchaeota archaeon]|nr:type I-A CRISPR-associated protein Cas7/Csa2 [Thermoproteota archaeon]
MSAKPHKKKTKKTEEQQAKESETASQSVSASESRTSKGTLLLGLPTGTFLSISMRVLINVEALNAVEPIGNIIRHRRATIIVPMRGALKVVTVPAISGECLKHAYQSWLAKIADLRGLPVCEWCRRGEFIKHGAEQFLENEIRELLKEVEKAKGEELVKKITAVEAKIIQLCVVEDVGGFMLPTTVPIRRVSRVQFSYAVPPYSEIENGAARLEPQFHTRQVSSAIVGRAGEEAGQAIFYVESGSSVYTLTINIDVSGIGYTSTGQIQEAVSKEERIERIRTSILALEKMMSTGLWGAKLGYYLPFREVLSCVAVLARPIPITVTPGHYLNYIADTVRRGLENKKVLENNNISEDVYMICYVKSGHERREIEEELEKLKDVEIERADSIEKMFEKIIEKTLEFESGQ